MRMRGITWYISSRWNLIPYLVFPYPYFLFTPMQNDSLIRPIEKWFFGGKKGKIWHSGQIDPQRNTPTTEKRFWMHWAKIDACQGKLWTHWRNQKKIKKSTRGYKFTNMPTPPPIFGGHHILHVGSDCGRNHTHLISSESVVGFRSPRWPKMTISHWLGTSPLHQCTH